ncbi:MAG: Rrf2 family transcriptional regulator [Verrucomicrobiota bacterium]
MRSDFIVGLHIMGFLTAANGRSLSSKVLAETYGTNPVVVRRILGKLSEAGLVKSQRGAGGGTILADEPARINLRDIYEAVTESGGVLPRYPMSEGGPSEVLGGYVNHLLEAAEDDLLTRLSEISISEMDRRVRPAICSILETAVGQRESESS